MTCQAPPLPPGTYYIGLLMDAACHLLDLQTAIAVHRDPVFVPFKQPRIFSETDFLKENVLISVQVYTALGSFSSFFLSILCIRKCDVQNSN